MLKLVFGIPQQNSRGGSKEKYTDKAVLTMLADKGKKTAKKFEFNKLASELLSLGDESKVSISFSEGKVYIVNSTGIEDVPGYMVTKNKPKSFSNSKVYDYITTFLGLSNDVDNEFELSQFENQMYNNAPICEVRLMKSESTATSQSNAVADSPWESDTEEIVDVIPNSNEEVSIYSSTSHSADGVTSVVQVSEVQ